MKRIVICRVANGAKAEFGRRVTRRSEFGLVRDVETTWEYDAPRIFMPGPAGLWPEKAPAPESIRSIAGNVSECGGFAVLQFNPLKGYGGPELIVSIEDVDCLAQSLANEQEVAVGEAEVGA